MVLSIGEILADMIGVKEDGVNKYLRFPGGAPLNVACGIERLNGNVGFIGSVGKDIIGKFLLEFVKGFNFKYLDVNLDDKHNTTLAFVDINEEGERDFAFNRYSSADYFIDKNRLEAIKNFDIIHFGSLMLREKEGREAANNIIKIAKKNKKLVSFDINFRSDIYNSKKEAIDIYSKYIKQADILKFSEDEVELFSNEKDIIKGLNKITNKDQIVFVTLGKKGSMFKYQNRIINQGSISITPIDTTGAGDAFYASVLAYLDEHKDVKNLSDEKIKEMLFRSNVCGALACLKKGAISSLPTTNDLKEYIK